MSASALLVSIVLAAGHPIPPGAWLEPERSFGALTGFRVRVHMHSDGPAAHALGEHAQQQIEAALDRSGIQVVAARPGEARKIDATGDLVLDMHLIEVADGTAVTYDLHASQVVQLWTGAWAFASTWEVGALIHAVGGATEQRLHDSLELALDDFCKAYRASRDTRPRALAHPRSRALSGTEL